jgi:hypothetical protein
VRVPRGDGDAARQIATEDLVLYLQMLDLMDGSAWLAQVRTNSRAWRACASRYLAKCLPEEKEKTGFSNPAGMA